MVRVIRAFRERFHGLKRYNVGDEYPEDDTDRVIVLAKLGYVEIPAAPPKSRRRKKGADADGDSDG